MGCLAIEVWPTEMEVWAFMLALLIGALFVIPIGTLLAYLESHLLTKCIHSRDDKRLVAHT